VISLFNGNKNQIIKFTCDFLVIPVTVFLANSSKSLDYESFEGSINYTVSATPRTFFRFCCGLC